MAMCLEDTLHVNGSPTETGRKMTVKHLFSSLNKEMKSTRYYKQKVQFIANQTMVQHLEETLTFILVKISKVGAVKWMAVFTK